MTSRTDSCNACVGQPTVRVIVEMGTPILEGMFGPKTKGANQGPWAIFGPPGHSEWLFENSDKLYKC